MTLSMPNTRKVIRKQEEVAAALRAGLRAKGVTRHSQREKLMQKVRRLSRQAGGGHLGDEGVDRNSFVFDEPVRSRPDFGNRLAEG